MSEEQKPVDTKADLEKVMNLFGLSHDLIAQAQFPGHVSSKVNEALRFLSWHYQEFKSRVDALAKAAESKVETPVQEEAKA